MEQLRWMSLGDLRPAPVGRAPTVPGGARGAHTDVQRAPQILWDGFKGSLSKFLGLSGAAGELGFLGVN